MLKQIRLTLLTIVYLSCLFITIFVCLFRPRHPDNTSWYARISAKLCNSFLNLNIVYLSRFTDKHPDPKQPVVIIGNHQSMIDLILYGIDFPWNTVCVAKKQLKWAGPFGLAYYLCGNYFLDRGNQKKSLSAMTHINNRIKQDKRNIWIFPEGTRNRKDSLAPFKKGAFYTALQNQTPLIPVLCSYYGGRMDLNNWKSKTIYVEYLDPIETKGFTTADVDAFAQKAHAIMSKAYADLNQRIAQPK
jgi:1-acyl-sn-glycerol-3-phosphate acyltransferase